MLASTTHNKQDADDKLS